VRTIVSAWLACAACGGESEPPNESPKPPAADAGCSQGVELPGGECITAGVPADACAEGFESDDAGGCSPVLPAEPCGPGSFAVPGEPQCHEVAPCGDAKYGEAPIEPTTQFVDAAFGGGDSDGSEDKPWTVVQDAIDAAESGAVVAIAAGTYPGSVFTAGKSVRIWGRCPSMVTLEGTGASAPAVQLAEGGAPELHAVSVTGPFVGIFASDVTPVVIDRVRVHDTGYFGIACADQFGPASCVVRRSLVERATGLGVAASGVEIGIEKSAIRDTIEIDEGHGNGILVQVGASLQVRGSVIASNVDYGVRVVGSTALLEGSVVHDIRPDTASGRSGVGAGALAIDPRHRSSLTVRGSVISQYSEFGLIAASSELVVEGSVVRDAHPVTTPLAEPHPSGTGVAVTDGATLDMRESLVARCIDAGFAVRGATATLQGVAVRETVVNAIVAYEGGAIDVRTSIFDASGAVGVYLSGASGTLDEVAIRDTKPSPVNGLFGDGIAVEGVGPASAVLSRVRIESSARAGLSNFGATVSLGDVLFECTPIPLDGETHQGASFTFEQTGPLACGCGGSSETCSVQTSNLAPPTIVGAR